MRIAIRKVWRDLWHNKGRTLLVVMSIAVGVMSLGMTVSSNSLLVRQLTRSLDTMNPSHAFLILNGAVNDETLKSLNQLPEVAHVEGTLTTGIRWKTHPEDDWRDANLKAMDDYEQQQFDLIELREGSWPDRNSIAVAFNHIAAFNLPDIGGSIYLEINNREREIPILGTVRDPFILTPPFEMNPYFYSDRDFFRKLTGFDSFSQLRLTVPEYSPENVEKAVNAIEKNLRRQNMTVAYYQALDPNEHFAQSTTDGIGLILTIMAIASLGLSTFLVINIMNALLVQQIPQIGIMKTVGGLSRQIAQLYLSGVMVYGLLGLVVAVPLGAVAGNIMSGWMLALLNVPTAQFEMLPEALALQFTTGLLTPVLAALWPVYRGVAISVREAVSDYGVGSGKYGTRFLDRMVSKIQGLPRLVTLTLRNTLRRPGRVGMTQVTLLVAGAIFMMVLSASQSFNYSLDKVFSAFGFDVLIVFESFQRTDEITPIIASRPLVDRAEMWIFYGGFIHTANDANDAEEFEVVLRGIPENSELFTPDVTVGRNLEPDDGHAMLINQKLAGDLGVTVGDWIILDLGDSGESQWQIVGMLLDMGAGPDQNTAYVPRAALNTELNTTGRAIVAEIRATESTLAAMEAIEKDLRTYFAAKGIEISGVQSILEIQEQANAQFNIITQILMIMVFLIAIVGGLGLSGTLSINVFERRREIGVMRAVGASSWDVGRVFIGEGMMLGILSWVQAIPLGYLGGKIFVDALGKILEFPFEFIFSFQAVWIWLVLVILLAIIASWVPANRATQISVNESLAYQ